jgi:hypothetical protein
VRHMIRHIVKLGHYQDFMAAMAAWNEEALRVGLPAYRIWDSQFGAVQEVFTEGEFASLVAYLAAFEAARTHGAFSAANDAVSIHLVDGSLHDYVLEEV